MRLGLLDWLVLGGYSIAILAVGLYAGRGERNTHDFFLGGKRQHWFVVGLSIIATEVSALTFISVPADSYRGDWNYLQMYAGAFIGRMLIILLLLPAFYGNSVTTVYEYLGRRFGPWTRTAASLMFVVSRIIGSGFRLLAASLAIALVFNWPLTWVVVVGAGVAVAYTTFGGIKSIIWTDALQAIVFVAGGLAAVVFLFDAIPGTWAENLATACHTGKLKIFTWDWRPNNDKAFWVLFIYATVQNMAALGVDQDLTQRMLTCPDLRRGQRSLMFNALAGLPIVCLFLLIGTLIYIYLAALGGEALPPEIHQKGERIFPHVIAKLMPSGWGLKGLLIAGIFAAAMSSLDSALGALSSTAVTDLYRPFVRTDADERHYLRMARLFALLFGALLVGVALAFARYDALLWQAFQWVSIIFGGMLGVFLLGVTTRNRGQDVVNTIAMLTSVAGLAALKWLQERHQVVYVAWPWWIVLGTLWTYVGGVIFPTLTLGHPVNGAGRREPAVWGPF